MDKLDQLTVYIRKILEDVPAMYTQYGEPVSLEFVARNIARKLVYDGVLDKAPLLDSPW